MDEYHGDNSIRRRRMHDRAQITGILTLTIATVLLTTGAFGAGDARTSASRKALSQDELVLLALSAAPAHIAKEAAVTVQGEDGKLVEARKGTNGFTCVPMADPNVPTLDPCAWTQPHSNGSPR